MKKILIISEIWRDGGSLSATVSDGESLRSFWLQTNAWDSPSGMGHLELYVSEGSTPDSKETLIELGSAEETRWFKWLEEVSTEGASEDSKERFSQLMEVLRKR